MTDNREYNQIDAFKRAYRLLKEIETQLESGKPLRESDDPKGLYYATVRFLDETEHLR